MAEFDFEGDEYELDIASPADCWELVASSPSSPMLVARVDISALEEAVAATGSSGQLLQDNYFGRQLSASDDEFLPLSTTVVDTQNENEMYLAKMDTQEDAGDVGFVDTDPATPSSDLSATREDYVHSNAITPPDATCMLHNDYQDGHKMLDEYMTNHHETMEHDCRLHAEDVMHIEYGMNLGVCANVTGNAFNGDEPAWIANTCHDIRSTLLSSASSSPTKRLVLLSDTPTSSHDSNVNNLQNSLSTSVRELAAPSDAHQEPIVTLHDTFGICKSRLLKCLPHMAWVWAQFSRWQARLKCANTIWSVALAAAVMGIIFLGRGWQRVQAHNQSLQIELCDKDKRITQLMFQLMQMKESLYKSRRVPIIWAKPSLQIKQDYR